MSIRELARPELLQRSAYRSASPDRRHIRLHANESPWALQSKPASNNTVGMSDSCSELNRYPDPRCGALIDAMAAHYGVACDNVLPVRGSDDGIDLLIRAFCAAGQDAITVCEPTFSMYASFAGVQGAQVKVVPLNVDKGFTIDVEAVLAAQPSSKLVFICSPNNPLGNPVATQTVELLCEKLAGKSLVVVDEAYGEFSTQESATSLINRFSNLVVLKTLSKAFGAAGIRCGSVLGSNEIIDLLRSIASPYAMPTPSIEFAQQCFSQSGIQAMQERVRYLVDQCRELAENLKSHACVHTVYPSDANFLLVRFHDAEAAFRVLLEGGVLVRDFSTTPYIEQCLRISTGTESENKRVLELLDSLMES